MLGVDAPAPKLSHNCSRQKFLDSVLAVAKVELYLPKV
jgi:hypothetical protein